VTARLAFGRLARQVVDFSPEVYRKVVEREVPVVYGDISHLDTLEHVGIERARVVISTVSEDFRAALTTCCCARSGG
jgi:voltage-gated potassium channel Kch